jgi:hypothetical protein
VHVEGSRFSFSYSGACYCLVGLAALQAPERRRVALAQVVCSASV